MRAGHLSGCFLRVREVSSGDLNTFFDIYNRHYDAVCFEQFKSDFSEKDFVIILKEEDSGKIKGFSTIALYDRIVCGKRIKLLYSGDTVIEKSHWGQQELLKTWCNIAAHIYSQLDRGVYFYWLLMSKGYRTYLYLPFFFKEFYPCNSLDFPSFEKSVVDDFGRFKYPKFYDPLHGLVIFDQSKGHLKPTIAETPIIKQNNSHVSHFLNLNPGFYKGDELVCITRIETQNMKSFAKKYFIPIEERVAV